MPGSEIRQELPTNVICDEEGLGRNKVLFGNPKSVPGRGNLRAGYPANLWPRTWGRGVNISDLLIEVVDVRHDWPRKKVMMLTAEQPRLTCWLKDGSTSVFC